MPTALLMLSTGSIGKTQYRNTGFQPTNSTQK